MKNINTLFLDLGGVVLTNGWDRGCRERASQHFGLDFEDFEQRHSQGYNIYEEGKVSLDDYLNKAIFWKKRDFTPQQFKDFMIAQSKPYPEMLKLISDFKKQYHLRVAVVSNEALDLTEYRIKTFNLTTFVDDFFVSCFLGYRKPDPHIYKIALDVTQVPIGQVLYIDDRKNLIDAASSLGIHGLLHTSYDSTRQKLTQLLEPNLTPTSVKK